MVAIGFGSADEAFLRSLATTDQAALYVPVTELASTFGQIAQVLLETAAGSLHTGLALRRAKR